jgi:hypothetical protein
LLCFFTTFSPKKGHEKSRQMEIAAQGQMPLGLMFEAITQVYLAAYTFARRASRYLH